MHAIIYRYRAAFCNCSKLTAEDALLGDVMMKETMQNISSGDIIYGGYKACQQRKACCSRAVYIIHIAHMRLYTSVAYTRSYGSSQQQISLHCAA